MSFATLLAIYFLIWWMVLFTVLPWGATSAHEQGSDVEPGHAPSAPIKPSIMLKLAATTVIAAVIMALGSWLVSSGILSLDSFPFLPDPVP
jgi:predicted secreted protein